MYEAKCYDLYGNSIEYFTQWDVNQKIVVVLEGCGDDYHINIDDTLETVPEVHFTNIKRDKALAVQGTIDGNKITVDVPNIILEEPYPLLVYVYYTSSKYPSAQSTIARTEIPVRAKDKPHDYYYVENITTVTAEMIKQEILAGVEEGIDAKFADTKAEIDTNIATVNENIANTDASITAANERMEAIETSISSMNTRFDETTASLNEAIADVQDLRDFIAQAETESEVSHVDVETQTHVATNVKAENSMAVGSFVFNTHSDGSMSLDWVGGEV